MAKPKSKNGGDRIIFSGGHAATTALAVIQEVKLHKLPWDIYWVGSKRAFEGRKLKSLESKEFSKYSVKFVPIIAGKVQSKITVSSIFSLFKIPIGFIHALVLLSQIKPKLILSFGGFSSYPVVVVGSLMGVPVIIHEQTTQAGRVNQKTARYARVIAIARSSSKKYFPKEKTLLIGNPLMQNILSIRPKIKKLSDSTIYITGGSRGSKVINSTIKQVLDRMLNHYKVIHQTGDLDIDKFSTVKSKLPKELREKYEVFASIGPDKVHKLYNKADLVIARAGANTVSELLYLKIPSILIPIPWTYNNEQQKNAEYAKSFGIGTIIKQDDLTSEVLLTKVDDIFRNYEKIKRVVASKKSPDIEAAGKLVDIVKENLV